MTSTTFNNDSSKTPMVAPLYFEQRTQEQSTLSMLPAELLTSCLVDYASWGDLAKLACVQSSLSTIVLDAAASSGDNSKWELAQALLEGTHGLQANVSRSMALLHELAGVSLTQNDETEKYEHSVITGSTVFAPAMKRLATCYLEQDDTHECPDNNQIGLTWLQATYEVGNDVEAAHELALLYEYGTYGTSIDVFAAATWFHKAALGGHVEGMAEYAMCCELGCGREANDEEALEWYTRAAQEGHVNANFSVGEAFEEARGVPQSDEEACLWYYKAAVQGDEGSKQALRRLSDIARIVVPGVGAFLEREIEP